MINLNSYISNRTSNGKSNEVFQMNVSNDRSNECFQYK